MRKQLAIIAYIKYDFIKSRISTIDWLSNLVNADKKQLYWNGWRMENYRNL